MQFDNDMFNNPKPNLNSPLAAFCSRHGITNAKLAELCERDGKMPGRTTCFRLINNQAGKVIEEQLFGALAINLPEFLFKKGLGKAEIDQQLLEIFERGEYQPMVNQRNELSIEAQNYYGFSDKDRKPIDPFAKPPQHRDEVFISPALQMVIDRVIDAIKYQGFVCVTGEIGSGKSTMRALLEDQILREPNIRIVWPEFFDMRNVTPMQIAEAILKEFNVEKIPKSAIRRGAAVKELLARLYRDGVRVAIGFDECHRLNDAALSSLKNFLEMNSGGFQRYLGVILFGQPIFEARLREVHFREIVERVVPLRMPDFADSAADYLAHRLKLVGGDLASLFDQEAVDLICRQATTPLALGNIANEAFKISMESFGNKKVIGAAIKTKMFFENRTQSFTLRKAG